MKRGDTEMANNSCDVIFFIADLLNSVQTPSELKRIGECVNGDSEINKR